jgi:hypothetical protein
MYGEFMAWKFNYKGIQHAMIGKLSKQSMAVQFKVVQSMLKEMDRIVKSENFEMN